MIVGIALYFWQKKSFLSYSFVEITKFYKRLFVAGIFRRNENVTDKMNK